MTQMFAECKNNQDRIWLKESSDSIDKWSRIWQIHFKAEKCKVMHIGNKSIHIMNTI